MSVPVKDKMRAIQIDSHPLFWGLETPCSKKREPHFGGVMTQSTLNGEGMKGKVKWKGEDTREASSEAVELSLGGEAEDHLWREGVIC